MDIGMGILAAHACADCQAAIDTSLFAHVFEW